MVARLLAVESTAEPTEIVIHVNMLKEGWDVTNLYTIVPLRPANARTLIEQSIGRGLRLPYGKRTRVYPADFHAADFHAADRLNIVAHDKFQEIVDEARTGDSPLRLQQVVLDPAALAVRTVTVTSRPTLADHLGLGGGPAPAPAADAGPRPPRSAAVPFPDPADREVARITYDVIRSFEDKPAEVRGTADLTTPTVQARLLAEVERRYRPSQPTLPGVGPDVAAVVARTAALVAGQTIDIPRILVLPRGEQRDGFRPFALSVEGLNYQPPSEDLWLQHLRSGGRATVSVGRGAATEQRLEDYVVSGLVDFDDVSYDDDADLLYELAGRVVAHFRGYLSEADIGRVLAAYRQPVAAFVHAQMAAHARHTNTDAGYDVEVSRGFTELKACAYTAPANDPVRDFRLAPPDKANIGRYLFGGFARCLYGVQKFQSDTERVLAVVLDRDADKWFRPARGQFQIWYRSGGETPEYQPDFVAEAGPAVYLLETKRADELSDAEVVAKRDAAVLWCARATAHTAAHGGKPWHYVLIPHDAVAENRTLAGLADQYRVTPQ